LVRWAAAIALAAVASGPVYAEAAEVVHVVTKGQTLVRIAQRYRTSVEAIRATNRLKPRELLKPGLHLVIPQKGKEADGAKKATARHADRLETAKKGAEAGKGAAARKNDGKKKDPKVLAAEARSRKPVTYAQKPKRPGFVRIVRGTEKLEAQLITRQGRLVPSALPGVTRMLRHFNSNAKTPVDPRLATLLGMVSDHFGGRTIHVVSGYRPVTPTQYTKHSNHNVGRAVDFMVEGVPNTVVRDFCRTFRNAGVGYYPNSSFVHMDVRSTKVYWVDYSRPGEAPRYDSPVAQAAADEATGDVDNAPGTGGVPKADVKKEGSPTPVPGDGGSSGTHPPPAQLVDPSAGNWSSQAPGQ
jgi:uncharacterized protein YcbK (DUF882 family)